MNALARLVVAVVLAAAVLGAGSAIAYKAVQTTATTAPNRSAHLVKPNFASSDRTAQWDCTTHSWNVKPAFADRWNALWQPSNRSGFVWHGCAYDQAAGRLERTNAAPEFMRVTATPPFTR